MRAWILLTAVLLSPIVATAQDWSSEQREIIAAVEHCYNGWVASLEVRDFDIFLDRCPQTDSAVYWYMNSSSPIMYTAEAGSPWRRSADAGDRLTWSSLEPMSIEVDGDTALIYFSVVWTRETLDGDVIPMPSRRLNVFKRRDGRWLKAGGAISPVIEI